jgi:ubiquinone/menaquinone biosynthesis C-methylase UbiE
MHANTVMIAEARQRVADLTLPVAIEVGDAQQMDFPDNTFDLCRTERVLRYLDGPKAAVGEMTRLACQLSGQNGSSAVTVPLAARVITTLDERG